MARAETTVESLQHSKQRFGSPTYELTNAKTQSCRVTKDENPMTLLALLTAVVFNVPASLGFSWSSRTMDKNDGKSCTSIWAYRAVFARECVLNGKGVYMRRQLVFWTISSNKTSQKSLLSMNFVCDRNLEVCNLNLSGLEKRKCVSVHRFNLWNLSSSLQPLFLTPWAPSTIRKLLFSKNVFVQLRCTARVLPRPTADAPSARVLTWQIQRFHTFRYDDSFGSCAECDSIVKTPNHVQFCLCGNAWSQWPYMTIYIYYKPPNELHEFPVFRSNFSTAWTTSSLVFPLTPKPQLRLRSVTVVANWPTKKESPVSCRDAWHNSIANIDLSTGWGLSPHTVVANYRNASQHCKFGGLGICANTCIMRFMTRNWWGPVSV